MQHRSSTLPARAAAMVQGPKDALQEGGALVIGIDREALEVCAIELDVGEQAERIFVKVQEGARPQVEGSRPALLEDADGSQAREKRRKLYEAGGAGVLHAVR